jgi:hypothetical protein
LNDCQYADKAFFTLGSAHPERWWRHGKADDLQ